MTMEKQPNILIFMADHYRGDMAPPYGRCLTPNLDSIYREGGVAFTNCFCASPHCCPSRATFHTGLYPTEHGVWNNVAVSNTLSGGLNDGVSTWSMPMAEKGYRLYHSGKWHVSVEAGPEDFGWINIYGNEKAEGIKGHRPAPDPHEWARYTKSERKEISTNMSLLRILHRVSWRLPGSGTKKEIIRGRVLFPSSRGMRGDRRLEE